MTRADAIARLRAHESDLRQMGIERLSLFGSVARGEEDMASDVDLAAIFAREAGVGIPRFLEIEQHLQQLLGTRVDLVGEPARRARMQSQIDRDRVSVF